MDFLLDQLAGFIVGIVGGLITGVWGLRAGDRRKRRAQVRQVTAAVVPVWEPVPGKPNTKVMTSGLLTVRNNSEWPVRDVILMTPRCVTAHHIGYLGPGDERVESITKEEMLTNERIDSPVTMQLEDDRRQLWRWTPAEDKLSPIPEPIPWHSHVVQWLDKRSPRLFHSFLWRLPKRTRDWLWGYAPEG